MSCHFFDTSQEVRPQQRPNLQLYQAALKSCGDAGRWEDALQLLQVAPCWVNRQKFITDEAERSVISWLSCHIQKIIKFQIQVFQVFQEVRLRGFQPSVDFYNSAMTACAAAQRWGDLQGLFEELQNENIADAESYRLAMEACNGLQCQNNVVELLRTAEEQLAIWFMHVFHVIHIFFIWTISYIYISYDDRIFLHVLVFQLVATRRHDNALQENQVITWREKVSLSEVNHKFLKTKHFWYLKKILLWLLWVLWICCGSEARHFTDSCDVQHGSESMSLDWNFCFFSKFDICLFLQQSQNPEISQECARYGSRTCSAEDPQVARSKTGQQPWRSWVPCVNAERCQNLDSTRELCDLRHGTSRYKVMYRLYMSYHVSWCNHDVSCIPGILSAKHVRVLQSYHLTLDQFVTRPEDREASQCITDLLMSRAREHLFADEKWRYAATVNFENCNDFIFGS